MSDIVGTAIPERSPRATRLKRYRTRRTKLQRWGWIGRVVSLALVLGGWELASTFSSPIFVPSVGSIFFSVIEIMTNGEFVTALATSLPAMLAGFGLALVFAVVVGTLMGLYEPVERYFDVYLTIKLATPTAALVPLIVILLGLSLASRILVVFLFCVVYMTVNTIAGIRSTRADLMEMGRSVGLSATQRFRKIILPSAGPLVMTGIRLGYSRAVVGVLLSEMIIINVGLGELLLSKSRRFETDEVFAVIIGLLILSVVGASFITWLDRRINWWSYARTSDD